MKKNKCFVAEQNVEQKQKKPFSERCDIAGLFGYCIAWSVVSFAAFGGFIAYKLQSDDVYKATIISDDGIFTYDYHIMKSYRLDDGRKRYVFTALNGDFTCVTVGDHTFSTKKIAG